MNVPNASPSPSRDLTCPDPTPGADGTLPMIAARSADWECDEEGDHWKDAPPLSSRSVHGRGEETPRCSSNSNSSSSRLILPQLREVPNFPDPALQSVSDPLREALNAIPEVEKLAYAEAMQRCPRLVDWESPPERYLRFDNFDATAAALRIVDYWEARLELFGPERAFLPLTLSSEGALNDEDLAVLRTGNYMVLANDTFGRSVVLHDWARLTSQEVMNPNSRTRCLFYVMSTVAERENSVDAGWTLLSVFSSKMRKITFDMAQYEKVMSLFGVRNIIPIRLASAHHILLSTRPALSSVLSLSKRVFDGMGEHKPKTLSFHNKRPLDEVQLDLRTHGFHLEGLPKVPLDGLFTFGSFRRWMDDRARLERKRYKHWRSSIGDNEEGSADRGADDRNADGKGEEEDGSDDEDGNSTSTNPEEEATRKRRALEAAYARRKRARKRIERRVHETEIDRLVLQGASLRRKGRELEGLLREATRLVRNCEEEKKKKKYEEDEEEQQQQRRMMVSLCAPACLPPTSWTREVMPRESLEHISSHQTRTYSPLDPAAPPGNSVLAGFLMKRTASATSIAGVGAGAPCDPHPSLNWETSNHREYAEKSRLSLLSHSILAPPRDEASAAAAALRETRDDALMRRVMTGLSPSDSQLLALLLAERQARRQLEATSNTTRLFPQTQPLRLVPPPPLTDDPRVLRWLASHRVVGQASAASGAANWNDDDFLRPPNPPALPAFLAPSAPSSLAASMPASTSIGSLLSDSEQVYRLLHTQDLQQRARFQELYELMTGNSHGGQR